MGSLAKIQFVGGGLLGAKSLPHNVILQEVDAEIDVSYIRSPLPPPLPPPPNLEMRLCEKVVEEIDV